MSENKLHFTEGASIQGILNSIMHGPFIPKHVVNVSM